MTYTYAILDVSQVVFDEITTKLRTAGYDHAFDRDVIDMHGIALRAEPVTDPLLETDLRRRLSAIDAGEPIP